jgi:hypothetical protein
MKLLSLLVLAVLAWWALGFGVQRALLFPRPASGPGDAALATLAGLGARQVWLDAAAARIEAWLLPAPTQLPARTGREAAATGPAAGRPVGPHPLLLYAHGNGELIDHWARAFEPVREWGVSVLLVEYPGYGRSSGAPSETSIREALVAAYDWAVAQPEIDGARILGHGRSLGGGAICALSRERRLAALVLESTFSSFRSMARRFGIPGFLVRDPFDNLAAVRAFAGPVLLLHGARDSLIAPWHARALQGAATRAEMHLLPCGHDDCPQPSPPLRRFLEAQGLLASEARSEPQASEASRASEARSEPQASEASRASEARSEPQASEASEARS